jgi:hypothetical protein
MATASVVVAGLAHRAADPRLDVEALVYSVYEEGKEKAGQAGLHVRVINRGRGEITIDRLAAFLYAAGRELAVAHEVTGTSNGIALPHRLLSKSEMTWKLPLKDGLIVDRQADEAPTVESIYAQVSGGGEYRFSERRLSASEGDQINDTLRHMHQLLRGMDAIDGAGPG